MINGRYSLTRYSANIGSEIEVSDSFVDNMRGVAGSAVFIDISDVYDETATCRGRITASLITSATINTVFGHSVSMVANVDVSDNMTSDMYGEPYASQNINDAASFLDNITGTSYLSVDIPTSIDTSGAVYGSSVGCKNLSDSEIFSTEVLLSTVGGGTVEDFVLAIDISIPPGGELRIDSENYTVLLNGENVLYAQSGYWPILSRDLAQMTVDSGTGGEMTGEIVFAERWL